MTAWRKVNDKTPIWESVLVYQKECGLTKSNKTGVLTAVQVKPGVWALSGLYGRTKRVGSDNILDPAPSHWMPLPKSPQLSAEGLQELEHLAMKRAIGELRAEVSRLQEYLGFDVK